MSCFILYLAALGLQAGAAATDWTFTSSGEMDITACPITYYGQKYQKVYVQQVELGNFGTQAILAIRTYSGYTDVDLVADTQVKGETVFKHVFPANETSMGVITDMSGCRLSGSVYMTNTTVSDPDICSTVTCNVNGVATAVSECPPMHHCRGNGSCAFDAMCTLTASTVIDFVGRAHTVSDRCGYTLMKSEAVPDVRIQGVFRERHHKDVSFLDHVILHLDSQDVQMKLLQGGRVEINDRLQALDTTATTVHGVELSKDQSGVTAKLSQSNYTLTVFFDGNMVQIHLKGDNEAAVHGLCGNSSVDFSKERVSEHSITGCETQHKDGENSMMDCNSTTEWCQLMWQDPFTQCHVHIDPEPFISACISHLCRSPAVDGLKCHFMEAYTRACRQQGNVTVEDWRSTTECAAGPEALCRDKFCSDHEFCGMSYDGEAHCLCRALFASDYRAKDKFGEPAVCNHSSASVNMYCCLLLEKGIDYTRLHLNDESCKGDIDDKTHMVSFNFDRDRTCGAIIKANSSKITYKNVIMTPNISSVVTRYRNVHMDFSCHFDQPDLDGLAIKIKDSPVIKHFTSGEWDYTLTMTAYTNPGRTRPVQSSTGVLLNEKIWVEVKAYGLEGNAISVVTESCWATDQLSSNGSVRYDLITAGCPNPADSTIHMEGNGQGTSNYFSFNMFKFLGSEISEIFLHCRVDLCVQQGNSCIQVCNQPARRRRSLSTIDSTGGPAIVTMAWA
ncbi:uncharacterized protein LOC129187269 [Dunckerocampus dactyliophorus]|uniref:uncharacterized protein LOC129187269 n=1 Tax=Dunckerocampus dactyliophorus TaxID=161453 RepID=UPI002404BC16|nr:uncharacterized protein LOC129187269 [Dunckerocampus dactyliophorus]